MDDSTSTRSTNGFIRSRVVQVHPTLRCNLQCQHCYSSSMPRAAPGIDPARLLGLLALLRDEGYEVVSFSGGEPLVYGGLVEVAQEAKRMGLRVNMITNGLLLGSSRMRQMVDVLGRVGVSIDGPPPLHDSLRGEGTFARTTRAMARLREYGLKFGIAHCLTQASLAELPWLADYGIEHGAALLQIHPLVGIGRGAEARGALDQNECARAFLLAEVLKIQHEDVLQVQLDMIASRHVLAHQLDYRILRCQGPSPDRLPLAELVNPVIVDEQGDLWPLAYGMSMRQRIATGPVANWQAQVDAYARGWAAPLQRLLRDALGRLAQMGEQFIDWYAYLTALSHVDLRPRQSAAVGEATSVSAG